ncbi:hypothetical protein JX265_000287 [Neoarthrinium moseri]|uniref:Cns1/TTC4 wheel domain-containing protein n=1 Tax=Neoarthrinium moseri TaxID=1658444 RepID=A0A9Q0AVF2_9PEZI|nr:hypothetical protein JX266_001920 [Neoarthrinium moseri]KAI1881461.1 hypothetical protein JX265_000287 [Neoarthrinium moseri]
MRVEEITDEVAEKLKVTQETPESPEATSQDAPAPSAAAPEGGPSVMGPEMSEARAMTNNKTVDEVWRELNKSPLFMTELEENDDTEALRALAYEGTPLEVATDFKERGNEYFRAKRWNDACEFYEKGILVLRGEERKRAGRDIQGRVIEASETEPDEPEEVEKQRTLLESMYVNRAASHLELKNYRSCWLDGAAALRLNPKNIKAYYRSAKALLAVDRIEEADDACARGLALDEENKALRAVAQEIIKKNELVVARKKRENERLAKEKRRELLLKAALKARGIRMRSTEKPPEMEDARVRLVPDEDDPTSTLSFPTVLLYPADLESDFIKAFNEQETVADHLSYVFPLPWDKNGDYTLAGVECYMDTVTGGLIKVGKKAPLLKILSSDKVEVVDEVVRLFVLPKAKAESWVQDYKSKKAAEKGS